MRSGVSRARQQRGSSSSLLAEARTGSGVAVIAISVVLLHRLRAGGLLQRAGVLAEEHLRLHLRARAA